RYDGSCRHQHVVATPIGEKPTKHELGLRTRGARAYCSRLKTEFRGVSQFTRAGSRLVNHAARQSSIAGRPCRWRQGLSIRLADDTQVRQLVGDFLEGCGKIAAGRVPEQLGGLARILRILAEARVRRAGLQARDLLLLLCI